MLTRSVTQRSKLLHLNIFLTHFSRYISNEADSSHNYLRKKQLIPCLPDDQIQLMKMPPEKVKGSRLLQVAILGVPNAGKSTLVNQLSGWNTNCVSKKVHTTRKTSKTVFVQDETQIVFLDTPGLVIPAEAKQHNLEASFLLDPEKALAQANLLLVLHDVSNKWTRGSLSPKILRLLHLYPEKESILVLNKIDLLKEKRLLLRLTNKLSEGIIGGQLVDPSSQPHSNKSSQKDSYQQQDGATDLESLTEPLNQSLSEKAVAKKIEGKIGWNKFSRVFMVSALDGDGVDSIGEYLFERARPGRWIYNSSMVTDQNPHELAMSVVRGKLLDFLSKELPYSVGISIEFWEVDISGTLNIMMVLDCKKKFTARVVVGTGGSNIIRLVKETEQELRNMFRQEVRLRIRVQPDTNER